MATIRETKKAEIVKQFKELQQINNSGSIYLGKLEKTEDIIKITSAVNITDCSYFEQAAKKYIKASNLGTLEEYELGGVQAYSLKKLTADQMDEVEILAIQVARLNETALAEFINSKF